MPGWVGSCQESRCKAKGKSMNLSVTFSVKQKGCKTSEGLFLVTCALVERHLRKILTRWWQWTNLKVYSSPPVPTPGTSSRLRSKKSILHELAWASVIGVKSKLLQVSVKRYSILCAWALEVDSLCAKCLDKLVRASRACCIRSSRPGPFTHLDGQDVLNGVFWAHSFYSASANVHFPYREGSSRKLLYLNSSSFALLLVASLWLLLLSLATRYIIVACIYFLYVRLFCLKMQKVVMFKRKVKGMA